MSAVLLTTDLACLSSVTEMAKFYGLSVEPAMSPAALLKEDAGRRLVLLDLNSPGIHPAELVPQIRSLQPSAVIIAFGPHVHEVKLSAARAAGCDEVLTRGQFHRTLGQILRHYVG